MSQNSFAKITYNGTAVTGDVTSAEVGGVDVSSDTVEVHRFHLGAATGLAGVGGAARATSSITWRPVTLYVPLDRAHPLHIQAHAENHTVNLELIVMDMNNDPGGDGATRHRFSIKGENGRLTEWHYEAPSSMHAETASQQDYMVLNFHFSTVTFSDVVNSAEAVVDWTKQK